MPGNLLPEALVNPLAALALWISRARARRELDELDDHLLKDIGAVTGPSSRRVGFHGVEPLRHPEPLRPTATTRATARATL